MSTTDAQAQVTEVVQALHGVTWESALIALGILAVGWIVVQFVLRVARRAADRLDGNPAMEDFLISCLRVVLYIVLVTIVAGYMGIPMTSLVALVSLLVFAVSMSVQNVLTNVVSGVVILAAKPFVAGDWIETPNTAGAVETIGLMYTHLLTADNRLVMVPNSELSNQRITNYSAKPTRRVDVTVRLDYEAEPKTVCNALIRAANAAQVGQKEKREPVALVTAYKDNGVEYAVRLQADTKTYWDVYNAMLPAIREELQKDGITMTYGTTRILREDA